MFHIYENFGSNIAPDRPKTLQRSTRFNHFGLDPDQLNLFSSVMSHAMRQLGNLAQGSTLKELKSTVDSKSSLFLCSNICWLTRKLCENRTARRVRFINAFSEEEPHRILPIFCLNIFCWMWLRWDTPAWSDFVRTVLKNRPSVDPSKSLLNLHMFFHSTAYIVYYVVNFSNSTKGHKGDDRSINYGTVTESVIPVRTFIPFLGSKLFNYKQGIIQLLLAQDRVNVIQKYSCTPEKRQFLVPYQSATSLGLLSLPLTM